MRQYNKIFLFLLFPLMISSCKKEVQDAEIISFVENFYTACVIKKDLHNVDGKKFFTDYLYRLIEKVKSEEQKNIDYCSSKKLDIKPVIIEGSMFTSLYEGADSVKIEKIEIEKNEHTTLASVTILLQYTEKNSTVKWKDKLELSKVADGWKIQDIEFDKNMQSVLTLQQSLENFLDESLAFYRDELADIYNPKILSVKDAIKKYKLVVPDYILKNYDGDVFVFENDVNTESMDFDELFNTGNFCGAIFLKNLTATRELMQLKMDYGPLVIVLGNVKARNIFVSGGESYFHGDVTAEQTIVAGVYNHGSTLMDGVITCQLLISYDHLFEHKPKSLRVSHFLSEHSEEKPKDILLDVFYAEEEGYSYIDDTNIIIKAMREGISLLKK